MKVYRIYNDQGFPGIQTKDKTDILRKACEESKARKATVISVWKCDPTDDVLVEDCGIINEKQELVAEFFEGGKLIYD